MLQLMHSGIGGLILLGSSPFFCNWQKLLREKFTHRAGNYRPKKIFPNAIEIPLNKAYE